MVDPPTNASALTHDSTGCARPSTNTENSVDSPQLERRTVEWARDTDTTRSSDLPAVPTGRNTTSPASDVTDKQPTNCCLSYHQLLQQKQQRMILNAIEAVVMWRFLIS